METEKVHCSWRHLKNEMSESNLTNEIKSLLIPEKWELYKKTILLLREESALIVRYLILSGFDIDIIFKTSLDAVFAFYSRYKFDNINYMFAIMDNVSLISMYRDIKI